MNGHYLFNQPEIMRARKKLYHAAMQHGLDAEVVVLTAIKDAILKSSWVA
ncbi:TPA: hypothetical protein HA317_03225, partial [Candidatus Woesearchaeota archaeon]|nr:hypothetical protein [Candidatus Woesearchaeota archaeon]